MSETYTPQNTQSEFDKQTDEALELANSVHEAQLPLVDDLEFFNNAAGAARRMEIDVQDAPSTAQEVPVHHEKPSTVKRVIAGAGIAAVTVAGGAWAVDQVMDVADEHFQNVEEQNRKWAQEAEENLRQFDEGVVQIEVPNDEQK